MPFINVTVIDKTDPVLSEHIATQSRNSRNSTFARTPRSQLFRSPARAG